MNFCDEIRILCPPREALCQSGATTAYFLLLDCYQLKSPFGGERASSSAVDDSGVDDDGDRSDASDAEFRARIDLATTNALFRDAVSRGFACETTAEAKAVAAKTGDEEMWAKNTHFANTSTRDTLRIGSTVIPPLASFLISDIAQFSWPSKYSNYALVVADPPWPNLSASRANAYNTLDPYYLFSIDLKHHLVPGALVAVWVTHKLKYKQFVTDKLFPAWGVQFAAEWTWLKVTTHGDLMFDKKLANRRPYEILLIGRRAGHSDTSQLALPREMLFASVPSSHHSQKPFLDSLLEPYLPKPESPQPSLPKHFLISKLELFARMTRTGWHSWGNECLKFNHLSCLEERIFESKNQQNKV